MCVHAHGVTPDKCTHTGPQRHTRTCQASQNWRQLPSHGLPRPSRQSVPGRCRPAHRCPPCRQCTNIINSRGAQQPLCWGPQCASLSSISVGAVSNICCSNRPRHDHLTTTDEQHHRLAPVFPKPRMHDELEALKLDWGQPDCQAASVQYLNPAVGRRNSAVQIACMTLSWAE